MSATAQATTQSTRARATAKEASTVRMAPQIQWDPSGLPTIAQHMYSLMMRNVSSDGFAFADPRDLTTPNLNVFSSPGCVIAAPSFPANTSGIDQDYVYNWTRDAAITAIEISAANQPTAPGSAVQPLIDYVNFAQTCQTNATPTLAHASFYVNGFSRPWTEQNDGPALQTVAILTAWSQLDAATQAVAKAVIETNLNYLLGVYMNPTTNLWEEHQGYSFFARAAQLKCFREIQGNMVGIQVPQGVTQAIDWLENTGLPGHWDGSKYISILSPTPSGYDPNIDIVCASIYGAVPCTDTKLLATAALLRDQWANPNSPSFYPINGADQQLGLGPLLGRYPGDTYDGDMGNHQDGEHPWALCTCNFAELYYTLGATIAKTGVVPFDQFSAPFFAQIGVTASTAPAAAVTSLNTAADAMLGAVIYHSDHLELSEQFDGDSGYEKSVKNLTWSYAAFLSAARARTGQDVKG
jgi:glucoamylase